MKEIQQKIDRMIIHLGGYWRPLSGLARLLEEVGEVGGALHDQDEAALVEELLDVFVISTCLANQYAIELDDQSNGRGERLVHRAYYSLVREAGEVARTLNAYEGDKKLKASSTPGSLQYRIESVQAAVFDIAREIELDLYAEIGSLIDEKSARDFGRFDHTPDPITESAVRLYTRFKSGRYWGGIEAKPSEEASRYREREYNMERFFKIAHVEGLDGFVILQPDDPFIMTSSLEQDWKVPESFVIDEEWHGIDKFIIIRKNW
ncbi:nucleotide pyrophosphohydrolase [Exiguobacterium sp. SH0S1]|uniref:MazG nucleotide pyrophosphohydrolase domain-containing protein n=1 Tax=Exiguobacterium sp. SH0S1 TaxID=2510949 RepID=UPI00103DC25D|nr:MazG nucleotide pyrophosphohydrolase domain-containing protein [Exiguobacterium sp. SH0S1]TCI80856.1 nucleotide pyrophosphohydrolase [Exiguobacterium sp. SH0S1]